MHQRSKFAYQSAATAGVTVAELLTVVYGNLASDLLKAAEAVRTRDIRARCAASKHVLLLLGHLESWTSDFADEPSLADSLRDFYDLLRKRTLYLQTNDDEAGFRELAALVFQNREAWQIVSSRPKDNVAILQTFPEQSSSGKLSLSA